MSDNAIIKEKTGYLLGILTILLLSLLLLVSLYSYKNPDHKEIELWIDNTFQEAPEGETNRACLSVELVSEKTSIQVIESSLRDELEMSFVNAKEKAPYALSYLKEKCESR